MADIKAGNSRYPVMTKKLKYLDQNEKSKAATQFQDKSGVNKFSLTNNQQVEVQNKQHHLQDQQSTITANQSEVTGSNQSEVTGRQNLVRKIMRLVRCCTN